MVSAIRRCFGGAPPLLTQTQQENPLKEWRKALPSRKEGENLLSLGDYGLSCRDANGISQLVRRWVVKVLLVIGSCLYQLLLILRIKKRLKSLAKELGESVAELRYRRPRNSKESSRCQKRYFRLRKAVGEGLSCISRRLYVMSEDEKSTQAELQSAYNYVAYLVLKGYIDTVNTINTRERREEKRLEILDSLVWKKKMKSALLQVWESHIEDWAAGEIKDRLISEERFLGCQPLCFACRAWVNFFRPWDDLSYSEEERGFESRLSATVESLVESGLWFTFPDHPLEIEKKEQRQIVINILQDKIAAYLRRTLGTARCANRQRFMKYVAWEMAKTRINCLKSLVKPQVSIWKRIGEWIYPFAYHSREDYRTYIARIAPDALAFPEEVHRYLTSGSRGNIELCEELCEDTKEKIENQALKSVEYIFDSKLFEGLVKEYVKE